MANAQPVRSVGQQHSSVVTPSVIPSVQYLLRVNKILRCGSFKREKRNGAKNQGYTRDTRDTSEKNGENVSLGQLTLNKVWFLDGTTVT